MKRFFYQLASLIISFIELFIFFIIVHIWYEYVNEPKTVPIIFDVIGLIFMGLFVSLEIRLRGLKDYHGIDDIPCYFILILLSPFKFFCHLYTFIKVIVLSFKGDKTFALRGDINTNSTLSIIYYYLFNS